MRMFMKSSVAAVLACAASAAVAQNPVVLERLRQMNEQAPQPSIEQVRTAIAATAAAHASAAGRCAPTAIDVTDVSPATGARDILQGVLSGQVRNGWIAHATHTGCPSPGPYRYMVLQRPDGTLVAPLVNEGRGIANPAIMRDTSAQAAIAVFVKVRDIDPACDGRDMEMGPVRVASQSADLGPDVYGVRYTGSWTELWRFTTCGRTFDVPVEFRADGDGGAYTNVKASEIVAVAR
jgi:hypothetical protein